MVLSFHKPENLYAEVALLGLSLVIFLYRLCGGTNEWLRTHGVSALESGRLPNASMLLPCMLSGRNLKSK